MGRCCALAEQGAQVGFRQLPRVVLTGFTMPGAPSFSRTWRKGWVMGIIGALYERGRCRSQRETQRETPSWNPTLQKTKGGAPGNRKMQLQFLIECVEI